MKQKTSPRLFDYTKSKVRWGGHTQNASGQSPIPYSTHLYPRREACTPTSAQSVLIRDASTGAVFLLPPPISLPCTRQGMEFTKRNVMRTETAGPIPDIIAMMSEFRGLPLNFRYGNLMTGEAYRATLAEASPLLVLGGQEPGLLHKRLVFALLAQFYSKKWADTLEIILMEQQHALTPLLRDLSRTLFFTTTLEGIQDGVGYLKQALQKRLQSGRTTPALLVVLEVTTTLQQLPLWPEVCHLLSHGRGRGIFFIVVAVLNSYEASLMPQSFNDTVLLSPTFGTRIVRGETALPTFAYPLYRRDQANPTHIVIPRVDPPVMQRLLEQAAQEGFEWG